jgi:protein transport protein SEC24
MEIKRSSVEYIAPSEYMLRPPQPCVYLFLIDVSYTAVQSGVLAVACRCLLDCLGRLPGDARTMVGFVTYDSSLHFYNLSVGNSQPQMLIVSDVDDVFLPSPDSLLVNLKESKDLVRTLLEDLPGMFADTSITHSALGAAVTIAEKLLVSTKW